MMPNHFERERFAQTHRQQLLREAEHERLLEQLPETERRVLLPSLARLMLSLRALRMKLRKGFQRRIV